MACRWALRMFVGPPDAVGKDLDQPMLCSGQAEQVVEPAVGAGGRGGWCQRQAASGGQYPSSIVSIRRA